MPSTIQISSRPARNASPVSGSNHTKNEAFRTNFARIDTDASDDIVDDDGRSPPPMKLGKRDRMSPAKEDQSNLRRNRPVRLFAFHRPISDHCSAEESGKLQARSSASRGKYDQKTDFPLLFPITWTKSALFPLQPAAPPQKPKYRKRK